MIDSLNISSLLVSVTAIIGVIGSVYSYLKGKSVARKDAELQAEKLESKRAQANADAMQAVAQALQDASKDGHQAMTDIEKMSDEKLKNALRNNWTH